MTALLYPALGIPITRVAPPAPTPEIVAAERRFMPHLRLSPPPDGISTIFTVEMSFVRTDSAPEMVYRDGVRVDPALYTTGSNRADEALNLITFRDAPPLGALLLLDAYVATLPEI